MNPRNCPHASPMLRSRGVAARSIACALTGVVLCFGSACKSGSPTTEAEPGVAHGSTGAGGGGTGGGGAGGGGVGGGAADPSVSNAAVAAEVEKKYVIGPAAARDLNCRVDWQYIGAGSNLRQFTVQGDSVFALDDHNFLTRIKIQGGSRLWQVSVADPIEEILGINFLGERIYLTSGGSIVVLDAGTGSQIGRSRLVKIANTAPVPLEPFLIYGSRDGQIVWHSLITGYEWKSYQVAHSIEIQPLLVGGYIVTIGTDGTVSVLSASYVTQYWSKRLLNAIAAAPAVGGGKVYVAGLDQYLWAFDINTGRTLWKVLTESPLSDSPVLVGDRIYQQVPKQGLVCLNADPDSMGGQIFWKAPDVKGSVLFPHGADLFAWDRASASMSVVEAKRGSLVRTVNLSKVKHILAAGKNHDELYAASDDGRIVHLVPRN